MLQIPIDIEYDEMCITENEILVSTKEFYYLMQLYVIIIAVKTNHWK